MRVDVHAHIYPFFSGIHRGMPIVGQKWGIVKNGNEEFQFLPPAFENSNSTYETLLKYMDWMGVDKAILMPNVLYGYHNEYALEAMRYCPERLKAVALVDIMKGEEAVKELAAYHAKGFRGMKIECNSSYACATNKSLDQEVLEPIWKYCAEAKQPVYIHLDTFENYLALERILDCYPELVVVICHLGAESILLDQSQADQRLDRMLEMAKANPNVYFDLSGIFCSISGGREYPFHQANDYIKRCLVQVGPERMLWGSDYPGTLTCATYAQLIDHVERFCGLTEQEKELIMGLNTDKLMFKD